jgi:hypothetical protein
MMHGQNTAGTAWPSLTPEPERNKPELLARLDSGSSSMETDRISRIVLRGTSRRWLGEARAVLQDRLVVAP